MRYVAFCLFVICLSVVISPDDSEAQWIRNGNPVRAGESNQYINDIMVDDLGGLIIVWVENWDYGDHGEDIYIQRLDTLGRVCWAPEGVPVCTDESGQRNARLVSDGSGGVIVFWADLRGSPASRPDLGRDRLVTTARKFDRRGEGRVPHRQPARQMVASTGQRLLHFQVRPLGAHQ